MTSLRAFNRFWCLLCIGIFSSAIMMWCLWHYPVGTGIAGILVLLAFGISAALTRAVDVQPEYDSSRREA
jgi:hypothetical protein